MANDDLRIIRRPEVQRVTGLRRSSIYALMSAGTFPKAVPLGPRAVGWLASEVAAWIAGRVAERNDRAIKQSGTPGRTT